MKNKKHWIIHTDRKLPSRRRGSWIDKMGIPWREMSVESYITFDIEDIESGALPVSARSGMAGAMNRLAKDEGLPNRYIQRREGDQIVVFREEDKKEGS